MKKILSLLTLLIAFGSASSQGIFLPSAIVDSIIWKLDRGRTCDSLAASQELEINALNGLALTQGRRIILTNTKITQLEQIIQALQERANSQQDVSQAKIEKLKTRIRKFWRVVVIESGVIVVLVVLLI